MLMRRLFGKMGLPPWGLVVSLLATIAEASDAGSPIEAGAFAQDITPIRFPISVNGNMTDQLAANAHDPLFARCIVLKEVKPNQPTSTALAIVVCDSCMIPRDLMDRAKALATQKTGIPGSRILISATHAHSCPTLTGVFQSEPDAAYVDFLVEKIAQGIEQAHKQLEPARVGWDSFQGSQNNQADLLFNRRWLLKENATVENPFGSKSDRVATNPGFGNPNVDKSVNLTDPEISVVSIQSTDGRPIALLANYSLHYVGGVPGNAVSADYFGEFTRRITRKLKAIDVSPPFVGMLSNGTSGDVNNVDFRHKSSPTREPFEQINFVAELVADRVSRVHEKIVHRAEVKLNAVETEIELGVRKPSATDLKAAQDKISGAERPLKGLDRIYARETTLLAQYPATVRVKLQAIKIGSLAIVSSPCETFAETGLAIKKESPFPQTFTISLANGYNGYLPPPEQHALGGYETWRARSSYLAIDAEPKVRSTMLKLLAELNQ